jgi:hypothetical protein
MNSDTKLQGINGRQNVGQSTFFARNEEKLPVLRDELLCVERYFQVQGLISCWGSAVPDSSVK